MTKTEKNKDVKQDAFIEDEILECIWVAIEERDATTTETLYKKFDNETIGTVLPEMVEKGLITILDSEVKLTETGHEEAMSIIRRHRLAERLLNDVLGVSDDVFERGACQFEHFINEGITASICTLLGHPTVCPHGKKIPPGECCSHTKRKLQPVFGPLSRLRTGIKGKVVIFQPLHRRAQNGSLLSVWCPDSLLQFTIESLVLLYGLVRRNWHWMMILPTIFMSV